MEAAMTISNRNGQTIASRLHTDLYYAFVTGLLVLCCSVFITSTVLASIPEDSLSDHADALDDCAFVVSAIEFYSKLCLVAVKIQNISAYRMLAPEFKSIQPLIS